jgi:hypothetical protein
MRAPYLEEPKRSEGRELIEQSRFRGGRPMLTEKSPLKDFPRRMTGRGAHPGKLPNALTTVVDDDARI